MSGEAGTPGISWAKGVHIPDEDTEFVVLREAQVIGAILTRADLYSEVVRLDPSDFCVAEYRKAWTTIRQFANAGEFQKISPYAVSQGAGIAPALLVKCAVLCATPLAAPELASDMIKARAMREAMALGRQAQRETNPIAMSQALQRAARVVSEVRSSEEYDASTLINRFVANAEDRRDGKVPAAPTTGLPALDKAIGGLVPENLLVVAGRPGMGKAQPLTAMVRTIEGWVRMGDIRIGDKLMSVDGAPSQVIGIFPQGEKQVYRVILSDGRSTEACGEHLWEVHYRDWPEPRVIDTLALRKMLQKERYKNRLKIRTVDGAAGEDKALPVGPYLLGLWLANGCRAESGVRISFGDEETMDQCAWELPDGHDIVWDHNYDYRITSHEWHENSVLSGLRSLGLNTLYSHERYIPGVYLVASKAQRLALLQGLMDTDGWAEKQGSIFYSTASERLAKGVAALARSLGFVCLEKTKPGFVTLPDGRREQKRDAHIVCITGGSRIGSLGSVFRLERKRKRVSDRVWSRSLTVSSIEPIGVAECQCIMVSHPSHLYVTDDYIVTHNTVTTISIARQAAKAGAAIGYFSLEIGDDQFSARLMADELFDIYPSNSKPLAYQNLLRGQFGSYDQDYIGTATYNIAKLPLFTSFTASPTMAEIEATVSRWEDKAGRKMDGVFIDYSAFVKDSGNFKNNANKQVGEIFLDMKMMARRRKTCVVGVHQLNRGVELREDKRPNMSDLRDSGEIEQHADAIALLFREEYYIRKIHVPEGDIEATEARDQKLDQVRNMLEIIIDKNRAGEPGTVKAWCHVASNALRNMEQQS